MGELIAKTSILYQAKIYAAGEILPQNDPAMVNAWLEAGTASYEKKEQEKAVQKDSDTTPKSRVRK